MSSGTRMRRFLRRAVPGSATLLGSLGLLAASGAGAMPISDLAGDTTPGAFQTYDILSIDAQFTSSTLTFTVNLATAPIAPSANALAGLSGFIDIDVDQNPNTGIVSNMGFTCRRTYSLVSTGERSVLDGTHRTG